MIGVNNSSRREEESEIIKINPAMKRYFELEIETLQNALRDEGKILMVFGILLILTYILAHIPGALLVGMLLNITGVTLYVKGRRV